MNNNVYNILDPILTAIANITAFVVIGVPLLGMMILVWHICHFILTL